MKKGIGLLHPDVEKLIIETEDGKSVIAKITQDEVTQADGFIVRVKFIANQAIA